MAYKCDVAELRKAMIDCGITTAIELSDKSGVNRNTINDVLNEKILPSSSVMYRIADTLELSSKRAGAIFFAPDLRNT